MTGIQDFLAYRSLSQLCLSPDRAQAVFAVQKPVLEGNRYQKELWAYRLESGECRRLLRDGELGGCFFWEDARTVFYVAGEPEESGDAARNGKTPHGCEATACRRLDAESGKTRAAFIIPARTRDVWELGGGMYVFRREEQLIQETYPQELAFLEEYKSEFETIDEIPLWDNGRGFVSGKRSALYGIAVKEAADSGAEAMPASVSEIWRLTPPEMTVDQVKAKAGGLYFTARTYRGRNTEPGIYFLAAKGSGSAAPECLVEEGIYRIRHMDAEMDGTGGRAVYFTAQDKRTQCMTDDFGFYRAADGCVEKLPIREASAGDSVSSDCLYGENAEFAVKNGRIYYVATEGWDSFVKWADPQGSGGCLTCEGGSVNGFALLGREPRDGLLLTGLRGMKLQELYLCQNRELRQLTAFNEECVTAETVITPQTFTFQNHGFAVNYVVLPPAGFRPEDPAGIYPAILYIHGGAKVLYSRVFFHEMQYLAGKGYFVIYGNPHGSDGQGSEFARLLGHYGEKDYDDLMKAMDEALFLYPQIDRKRLGVAGGSYGGIMTNWIVGHTDRFRCAVAQRSICSMLSTFGTADNGFNFVKEQMDGDLWDGFERLWRQSPLKYANRCHTPLLLIHSDEDYRCHYTEAVQMFTALKYLGVETKICLIRGENHSLSRCGRPVQRIKRLYEIGRWFDEHLCGEGRADD